MHAHTCTHIHSCANAIRICMHVHRYVRNHAKAQLHTRVSGECACVDECGTVGIEGVRIALLLVCVQCVQVRKEGDRECEEWLE
mmetsp:Transcript_4156/g.8177  ORF Transcript_4156/g.8177 Transcript_4156/m.8177 type:complete len:84 (-) Transcript_4156:106-357(-)